MVRYIYYLCVVAQLATSEPADARVTEDQDVLSLVNLLIGSRSGGNVFAGATLPYGMAKGMGHEVPTMRSTDILTTSKPSLMLMAKTPEASPPMVAISPASLCCTAVEPEATPAWGTFPSFLRYAQKTTLTAVNSQSARARRHTATAPSRHVPVTLESHWKTVYKPR